jgi:hypothetical protein
MLRDLRGGHPDIDRRHGLQLGFEIGQRHGCDARRQFAVAHRHQRGTRGCADSQHDHRHHQCSTHRSASHRVLREKRGSANRTPDLSLGVYEGKNWNTKRPFHIKLLVALVSGVVP